ncbi:hypothetical protein KL86PLE_120086 [uncultured Pleomorphomonas sp.]|uniref:PilZ domain-containing protein n=2 Tax=uncultured Pleomorphomonas sp. TaxID=442121 RepID=A0A212L8F3_9HYPH|nr:hypothetical protein KL86PLE_120086 [uncultured Pleomorphomonas sp.]
MYKSQKLSKREMAELIARLRNPNVRVGEQRGADRLNCHWPALVHSEPRDVACVVENISHTGCRVRTAGTLFAPGDTVIVRIPSQKMVLDGVIAWARSEEAGIQFSFGEESHNLTV